MRPTTLLHRSSLSSADSWQCILLASQWLAAHWPHGAPLMWRNAVHAMPWPVPDELRALGFARWCSGAERVVFFHHSGWCLKVPIGRNGVAANRQELMLISTLPDEERRLFAETYPMDGTILLQRVYDVDVKRFLDFERTSLAILEAQCRLRVTDVTPINVGWREDGTWVFVDWAGGLRGEAPSGGEVSQEHFSQLVGSALAAFATPPVATG